MENDFVNDFADKVKAKHKQLISYEKLFSALLKAENYLIGLGLTEPDKLKRFARKFESVRRIVRVNRNHILNYSIENSEFSFEYDILIEPQSNAYIIPESYEDDIMRITIEEIDIAQFPDIAQAFSDVLEEEGFAVNCWSQNMLYFAPHEEDENSIHLRIYKEYNGVDIVISSYFRR